MVIFHSYVKLPEGMAWNTSSKYSQNSIYGVYNPIYNMLYPVIPN